MTINLEKFRFLASLDPVGHYAKSNGRVQILTAGGVNGKAEREESDS